MMKRFPSRPSRSAAAQGGDVHGQVGGSDEDVGPDARHQLPLAHQLAGAIEQGDQDFQGATPKRHRPVAFQQKELRRQQPERREQNLGLGARVTAAAYPGRTGTPPACWDQGSGLISGVDPEASMATPHGWEGKVPTEMSDEAAFSAVAWRAGYCTRGSRT